MGEGASASAGAHTHRIRETHIRFIGEHDDADILVWHHAHIGAEAARPSVVPNDVAVRRLLDDPAHRVRYFVRDRDLRRADKCEILGRDDTAPLEEAVAELKLDPARHVLDRRVDVTGPTVVVGESCVKGTSNVPSGVQR